jgi:hypothetical protein
MQPMSVRQHLRRRRASRRGCFRENGGHQRAENLKRLLHERLVIWQPVLKQTARPYADPALQPIDVVQNNCRVIGLREVRPLFVQSVVHQTQSGRVGVPRS